tara:strand:- start:3111 stop:3311 length:201 start_codon:yes stop_codon:yes gene_type:complete
MEIFLMGVARSTSKVIGKIADWICIRLDYYADTKEWEIEQKNHSFPAEWFMSDEQLEALKKREENE